KTFSQYTESGSIPPSIQGAIKAPTLQCSKDFSGSTEYRRYLSDANQRIVDLRSEFLTSFLRMKDVEETYLTSLMSNESIESRNKLLVQDFYNSCSSTAVEKPDPLQELLKANPGTQGSASGFFPFRDELRTCNQMGRFWLRRSAQMGLTKHHHELLAKSAKENQRKSADTAMKDLSSGDISKTVQQLVAKELKKMSLRNKPTKSQQAKSKPKGPPKKASKPSTKKPSGKAQAGKGGGNGKKNKQKR
ncbi:hypothetical protein F4804DRAFT_328766, partial [Jackrogersella minutella]